MSRTVRYLDQIETENISKVRSKKVRKNRQNISVRFQYLTETEDFSFDY